VSLQIGPATVYGEPVSSQRMVDLISLPSPISETASSAIGGVRLLEHILQRMRNSPQLAISKTKQTIAYKSQALVPAPEPIQSEANLLIKPKDLSRSNVKAKISPASAGGVLASANKGATLGYAPAEHKYDSSSCADAFGAPASPR